MIPEEAMEIALIVSVADPASPKYKFVHFKYPGATSIKLPCDLAKQSISPYAIALMSQNSFPIPILSKLLKPSPNILTKAPAAEPVVGDNEFAQTVASREIPGYIANPKPGANSVN